MIAHISDVHIGGSDESVERAQRMMRHLRQLPGRLDAIVVTGDIADHAVAEEYEIAQELLTADVPMIVCPGNHDQDLELFEKAHGPINQVLHLRELTIALASSTVIGSDSGYLSDETVAWLDEVLAERPNVPAFVGMHHPAVSLGIPYVDEIRLESAERLAAIVERHANVAGILVGHAHVGAVTSFSGLPHVVAPGVISTLLTPAETAGHPPISYDLPPAYAMHMFEDGRLTTHFRPVL